MGLFSDFGAKLMSDQIDRNGLPRGTNSECCERCQYRAQDPCSAYLVCAIRKVYVGASQVCQDFARGPSGHTIT